MLLNNLQIFGVFFFFFLPQPSKVYSKKIDLVTNYCFIALDCGLGKMNYTALDQGREVQYKGEGRRRFSQFCTGEQSHWTGHEALFWPYSASMFKILLLCYQFLLLITLHLIKKKKKFHSKIFLSQMFESMMK